MTRARVAELVYEGLGVAASIAFLAAYLWLKLSLLPDGIWR
jgi:hypothetical protein